MDEQLKIKKANKQLLDIDVYIANSSLEQRIELLDKIINYLSIYTIADIMNKNFNSIQVEQLKKHLK